MSKKANGFGLTSPVPPAATAPADADEFERELIKSVRQERLLQLKNELQNPGRRNAEPPPASTLGESTKAVIDTAKEATSMHKDVAEAYKDMAKVRKDERDEAEKRASKVEEVAESKAAQAVAAKEKEAVSMMDILNKAHEREIQFINQGHELESSISQRLADIESKLNAAQLEKVRVELKAEMQAIKDSFQHESEKKDTKIAEQQQQIEYLSGKETLESAIVHTLKTGEVHPTLQSINRLFGNGPGPDADPNHVYQTGMAGVLVDKAKVEVKHLENDLDSKKTKDEKVGTLLDNLVGLVGDARGALRNFVGGGYVPNRREVPPGPPEEEAGVYGGGDGIDTGEEAD